MSLTKLLCYTFFLKTLEAIQNIDICDIDFIVPRVDVESVVANLFRIIKLPQEKNNFEGTLKDLKINYNLKSSIDMNHKFFKDALNVNKEDFCNNVNKSILEQVLDEILNTNRTLSIIEGTVEREIKYSKKFMARSNKLTEPFDLATKFVKELVSNRINYMSIGSQIGIFNHVPSAGKNRKRKKRIGTWEPDNANSSTRRHIVDTRASIKNYPFLVSIHENGKFVCSGTIVRSELVITAASCLHRVYLRNVKSPSVSLRVGSNFVRSGGYVVPVTEAVFHPSYKHKSLQNNIVLLHVAEGALVKYVWIKRIKYEQESNVHTQFGNDIDSVVDLGWGKQARGKQGKGKEISSLPNLIEDALLCVRNLSIYNSDLCHRIYGRYFNEQKTLCTGSSNNVTSLCNQYDVGSPVIHNSSLLGIISLAPERCELNHRPIIVTKLAPYVTWIHEVTQKIIPMLLSVEGNSTYVKARRRGSSRPELHLNNKNKRILRRAKKSKIILNDKLKITNFSLYNEYINNLLTLMKVLPRTAIKSFIESKYDALAKTFKDTFSSIGSSDHPTVVSNVTNLRTPEMDNIDLTPSGEIQLEWKLLLEENDETTIETVNTKTEIMETSTIKTTTTNVATIQHPETTWITTLASYSVKRDYNYYTDHNVRDNTPYNNHKTVDASSIIDTILTRYQNTRFEIETQTKKIKKREQRKHIKISSDELSKMAALTLKKKHKISRSHKRKIRKTKRKKHKHSRKKSKH